MKNLLKWQYMKYFHIVTNCSNRVFGSCLPFASLPHKAFIHTGVYRADSSQYGRVTRILKSQTWLSASSVVLHVGDIALLSERRFLSDSFRCRRPADSTLASRQAEDGAPAGFGRGQALVALLLALLLRAVLCSYAQLQPHCQVC